MAGISKNVLVTLMLVVAVNQVSAATHTHFCSNTNGKDVICTVTTVPAEMGVHRCCMSISYSFNHPYSGRSTYRTCCHESTADLLTAYCSNRYAKQYCHQTDSYCCPSRHSSLGSWHRGCCSHTCSSKTSKQGCGGSNAQGKRNNALLLSMIGIATIVIFISMAIVPLPFMNFKSK